MYFELLWFWWGVRLIAASLCMVVHKSSLGLDEASHSVLLSL